MAPRTEKPPPNGRNLMETSVCQKDNFIVSPEKKRLQERICRTPRGLRKCRNIAKQTVMSQAMMKSDETVTGCADPVVRF